MSRSHQDSGVFGAVIAVCLLVIVGGGGFFVYRYKRALEAAMVATEQRAIAERKQQEAEVARAVAEKSIASKLLDTKVQPLFYEDTVIQKDASIVQADILSKLLTQQDDWNKGDLDAFMKVYWNNEKLTFASGGKVTRGYQATLDGYKSKYSTKEELGKLEFNNLEFQRLAEEVMLVLGTWHLERGENSIGGNFSLIWRKFDDQWLIVHDHTSALPTTP